MSRCVFACENCGRPCQSQEEAYLQGVADGKAAASSEPCERCGDRGWFTKEAVVGPDGKRGSKQFRCDCVVAMRLLVADLTASNALQTRQLHTAWDRIAALETVEPDRPERDRARIRRKRGDYVRG